MSAERTDQEWGVIGAQSIVELPEHYKALMPKLPDHWTAAEILEWAKDYAQDRILLDQNIRMSEAEEIFDNRDRLFGANPDENGRKDRGPFEFYTNRVVASGVPITPYTEAPEVVPQPVDTRSRARKFLSDLFKKYVF